MHGKIAKRIAIGFAAYVTSQIGKINYERSVAPGGGGNRYSYLSCESLISLHYFLVEHLPPILKKGLDGLQTEEYELETSSTSGKSVKVRLDRELLIISINGEPILKTANPMTILPKTLKPEMVTSDKILMLLQGEPPFV